MSQLLPDGITHLGDCPYPLHDAILTALRILGYEEWPVEERPPKRIWLDGEKLKAHFKAVERKRNEKYGISTADDDEPGGDHQENAVALELIKRG